MRFRRTLFSANVSTLEQWPSGLVPAARSDTAEALHDRASAAGSAPLSEATRDK